MAKKTAAQNSQDATACAKAACAKIGLYKGLNLTTAQFRARKCRELVTASKAKCPLNTDAYPVPLLKFREAARECLKQKGHERPVLMLQYLCATKTVAGKRSAITWGDWCNHLAGRL